MVGVWFQGSELSHFIQIHGLIRRETNAEDKLNACFACWEHGGVPVAFRAKNTWELMALIERIGGGGLTFSGSCRLTEPAFFVAQNRSYRQ